MSPSHPSRSPYFDAPSFPSARDTSRASPANHHALPIQEGRIVKWSVFLVIIVLITAYLLGGYLHARSRLKKGLPPKGYHRWMVPRPQLARVDPRYGYPQQPGGHAQWTTYRPADAYGMQNMGGMPPPPVYDPTAARPPGYEPPEGGSKVDPAQGMASWEQGQQREQGAGSAGDGNFAPPPGPPPPAVATNNTGNTNPFR